jgi:hypothetical protein
MGRKEEAHDAKTAYGGADHLGVEGCPGRGQCPGPVPEARHLGRDAPYMADKICGPSSQRRVCRTLDRLFVGRPFPETLILDNGLEFSGTALDAWAGKQGMMLHFIQPGKPVQNAFN